MWRSEQNKDNKQYDQGVTSLGYFGSHVSSACYAKKFKKYTYIYIYMRDLPTFIFLWAEVKAWSSIWKFIRSTLMAARVTGELTKGLQQFCIQDKTLCSFQDQFEVNAIVISMLIIPHAAPAVTLTSNLWRLWNIQPLSSRWYWYSRTHCVQWNYRHKMTNRCSQWPPAGAFIINNNSRS